MRSILITVLLSITLIISTCCTSTVKSYNSMTWSKNAIEWETIPLTVANLAHVEHFDKALSAWNVGDCVLLIEEKDPRKADVVVVRGGPKLHSLKKKKKDLLVTGYWEKRRKLILLFEEEDALDDMLSLTHELGHALGLKHDYGDEDSVMKPDTAVKGSIIPQPTEDDLVALRMRYCSNL